MTVLHTDLNVLEEENSKKERLVKIIVINSALPYELKGVFCVFRPFVPCGFFKSCLYFYVVNSLCLYIHIMKLSKIY